MIVKAQLKDVTQIVDLDESVICSRSREAMIRKAVEGGSCFVIPDDTGIAAFGIVSDHFFGRHFIELLIVREASRRKGCGIELLEYFKALYKGEKLFTSTNSSNTPMQKLLAKCGFERCGLIDRLDDGDPELVYCFEEDHDEFMDNIAREYGFSGVIHLSRPGGLHYEKAFGRACRDWGIPNVTNTRFNTASISKIFTACGILKLAEQGSLKLDDGLTDYLQFEGEPFSEDITLYHLLTHSSGIADDADEEAGENYEDLFVGKPNYSFRRASDLVVNFAGKKPVFSPGEGCRYNNAGYVLLGMVIEKVTGMEYKQWLTDNVLVPWGLEHTYFPEMDCVNTDTAEGYILAGEEQCKAWRKNIYSIPPVGTPEGGIYSTAGDLHLLLRGLTEGRFFSPEYTKLILTPKVLHGDRGSYQHWMGFGFEFYTNGGQILRIQKDGSNPGVSAVMAYYPDTGADIIILSNINCDVWAMRRRIEEHMGLTG